MMRQHKTYIVLLTALLLCLTAADSLASDVSLTATVDKTEASLEDYIVLKLAVEGTREQPEVPDMPAFKIQSRGSSSQMTIINGQMSSKMEYNYILYPQKTGAFTLGPFTIEYKGQAVKSNQVTVTIEKGQQQEKDSGEIIVTAQVDNESPYLNEQIICSFLFCRRVKIGNASLTEIPSFEGFATEDLGKEKEYQKVISGQQYVVTEIKKALFPIKSGVLEISPFTLQCEVVVQKSRGRRGMFPDPFGNDPFFGFTETVPKTFRTNPVTVMVKPLPSEGKPDDFKNLVGDVSMTSELNKTKLEVGESATLTLTLAGTGNLKSLHTIDISGLQNFKVYDDKPVFEPGIFSGKIGGRLVIKKALVPLVDGALKIPPVSVSFFNPASGSYKTAGGSAYTLAVSPSKEKEKLNIVASPALSESAKKEIKVLGKDILPVHTSLDALSGKSYSSHSPVYIILFIIPVFSYFIILTGMKAKERSAGDTGMMRSKTAYSRFGKEISGIKASLSRDDSSFYQLASKALKEFIGNKLNISGSSLTARELDAALAEVRIPDDMGEEISRLIEFFDSAQFGFSKHSADEKEAAFKTMKKLSHALDKKIKKS